MPGQGVVERVALQGASAAVGVLFRAEGIGGDARRAATRRAAQGAIATGIVGVPFLGGGAAVGAVVGEGGGDTAPQGEQAIPCTLGGL